VAVTRVLQQVGEIELAGGASKEVMLTAAPGVGSNGSRLVAFIQDPTTGRVLGVAAEKL
jgi:hypothetical protein